MTRGPAIGAIALAALSAAGGYFLRRPERAGERVPAARVRPQLRKVDASVVATGIVRLKTGAEVRVGAQISGLVQRLNVSVGAHVDKGAVIAVIDSRGLDERIAQARAQLDVDRAAIRKLELHRARLLPLAKDALISRQEIDDVESDLRQARARLRKSLSDLHVVESDRPYLTIRAPIAGTVASVSTQEGETVAAAFAAPTFVTIIEDRALELVAMVDETDIGAVKLQDPVTFTTETYPARDFHGAVQRIAPKATIVSGVVNYEVAISIEEWIADLRPDMTANVRVRTAQYQALMVPSDAIHRDGEQRFVYLARNGGIEKREVTAGPRSGGWNEVRKGLSGNEEIIVSAPEGGAAK